MNELHRDAHERSVSAVLLPPSWFTRAEVLCEESRLCFGSRGRWSDSDQIYDYLIAAQGCFVVGFVSGLGNQLGNNLTVRG